jgi:truncated hemoglobin YjbI
MTKPGTMFERYGGIAFVTRFVLSFYDRVLTSATIAPFFADVDMRRLVDHQAKFISSVMGGRRATALPRCARRTPICRSTIRHSTR